VSKDVVLGIDLGTTNSCMAAVLDGQPTVLPNRQGYRTTPSMVAVGRGGKKLVGQLAKRQQVTNPYNTVYATKRLIGRRFSAPEVKRAGQRYPYKIVEGPRETVRIELGGRLYSPEEVAGEVLASLKHDAEEYLGIKVERAVITVPAFFNDNQRQATKDAGRLAGIDVLRIINEPTAAAMAYGLTHREPQTVAIYDLGGGTFDISILRLNKNVFEVLSTTGDTYLGGEDIDLKLLEELLQQFFARTGKNLGEDRLALQRLKTGAEDAKIGLSFEQAAVINLPFIAQNEQGEPIHFEETVSREELEDFSRSLLGRTMHITEKALDLCGLSPEQIDHVILVGGQTRMPQVHRRLAEFFGKTPRKGINPDEVVALGAALQASALSDVDQDLLLLDVTPLSLGIATQGGFFSKLIEHNTPVPCKRSHNFTTVRDNQDQVNIQVFQGEHDRAADNELLGEFVLTGIRPASRGEPKIDVTFAISAEGIVSVAAKDLDTGKSQQIEVTAQSGLTESEMQELLARGAGDDVELRED